MSKAKHQAPPARVRFAVRQLDTQEAKSVAEKAAHCESPETVHELVRKLVRDESFLM